MRSNDWYMHMDERKAAAIRAGWEVREYHVYDYSWWIVESDTHTGLGETEDAAWSDILADAELWDEVTAAIKSAGT